MADFPTDTVSRPRMTENPSKDEAFNNSTFLRLMNSVHFPASAMHASATKLEICNLSTPEIKWGKYEQEFLLTDPDKWPNQTYLQWNGSVKRAREDMKLIKNNETVNGDVATIPPTRVDLLDALIQYCFENAPAHEEKVGIPIIENLRDKTKDDPEPTLTDFVFQWVTFGNDTKPSMLAFTILCRKPPEGAT
ncbi:MAG: hypothetical protein WCC64_16600 [Aliidongia sp.]